MCVAPAPHHPTVVVSLPETRAITGSRVDLPLTYGPPAAAVPRTDNQRFLLHKILKTTGDSRDTAAKGFWQWRNFSTSLVISTARLHSARPVLGEEH